MCSECALSKSRGRQLCKSHKLLARTPTRLMFHRHSGQASSEADVFRIYLRLGTVFGSCGPLQTGGRGIMLSIRPLPPLRAAPAAADTERGQSAATTDLVSATVAFRLICANVAAGGAMWMKGKPSPTGRRLLKQLLPETSFLQRVHGVWYRLCCCVSKACSAEMVRADCTALRR